jgi:hypothetical protein
MNCTCGVADDDMGHGHAGLNPDGKAITEKTFQEAAHAFGMTVDATKREVYRMLKEELEKNSQKENPV